MKLQSRKQLLAALPALPALLYQICLDAAGTALPPSHTIPSLQQGQQGVSSYAQIAHTGAAGRLLFMNFSGPMADVADQWRQFWHVLQGLFQVAGTPLLPSHTAPSVQQSQ